MTVGETTLDPQEAFFALRSRAFELANTGSYKDWSHVAYILLAERFSPLVIKRLDEDELAVMMISRICKDRRASPASFVAKIGKWIAARRNRLP